jgi:hypothetical protein
MGIIGLIIAEDFVMFFMMRNISFLVKEGRLVSLLLFSNGRHNCRRISSKCKDYRISRRELINIDSDHKIVPANSI